MNTSGEAAEQVVRMSLDGVEVVLKIAGAGAKNIAAMIYAALKDTDKNKVKGQARLISMLKSGKELSIFSVKNEDLKKFASEAKRYGIVYHPMRNTKDKDGVIDVMVYSADAPRINRIVERFKLATVDIASIKSELQKSKEHTPPEKATPEKSAEDKLLDELLTKPQQKEAREQENPEAAKTAKSRPSEPILTRSGKSEKGASDMQRKSVREALSEIKRVRKQEAEKPQREERQTSEKPQQQRTTKHQQPQSRKRGAKSKSKER